MARTELFSRRQPGGQFAVIDVTRAPGDIFFVSSGTGTDAAGYGLSPDTPVATLDYAMDLCTASKGDQVILMPGHAEALVGATSCVLNVAGVEVIGIGNGTLQPTFTLGTADAATISVTAANVRISNIKIISDLADVVAGITAANTADGLVVENCWFTDGAAAKELVIGLSVAAACDRVIIRDNFFSTVDGGGCASAIKLVGATANSVIRDNYIHGDYSAACLDGATAGGTYIHIKGNEMWNTDGAAGLAISLHATTTGAVVNNYCLGGKDGTSAIAAAGTLVCENYGTNAAGASGLIKPAVDA